MTDQLTAEQQRLLERYPANTRLAWITGEITKHAYVGSFGEPGPVECLCGSRITRSVSPPLPAQFSTCSECMTLSVLIRNRRLPYRPDPEVDSPPPRERPYARSAVDQSRAAPR